MRESQKGLAHFFLILVAAIFVLGILGYYAHKNGQVKLTPNSDVSIKTNEITPTPYEEIANGVYTNNLYRFRFKYPHHLLINFNDLGWTNPDQMSYMEAEFKDIDDNARTYATYTLNLYITKSEEGKKEFYRNYYRRLNVPEYSDAEEKERQLLHNNVIISKYKVQNYPVFIQYQYAAKYASDWEPSNGHNAELLKDDSLLLSFNIFSPGDLDETKIVRLRMLQDILESIEFF
jgi:hypothetical protein